MSKESVIETSKSFEEVLMTKDRKSIKAAFIIAGAAVLVAVMAVAAIMLMMPLKQTEVELYAVDHQTGRMERITRLNTVDISAQDAMAQYLSANYVNLREGYNYFSLQKDYNDVQQFSSPDVNKEYLDLFNSPNAPDKVYKNAANLVTTEIISNQIVDGTTPDKISTLRVKRTIRHLSDGLTTNEIWNIRLTFHYIPEKEMTDSQREVNPLGFFVSSYQRDKELRKE
ncbi:type IV secretion system protein [Lelliottia sp. V89_10]|uniref:virB8 family protein n=1 Tax=Lelliottia wanjuensis TaxID=3050585 RepID=UPI00249E15E2|nr:MULTISPECIES: type IV secretion system protein [unclassified Lelliottia]MDI3360321.1 type IV secretion system protein [Lelliottia sp. V89_13]MDK9549453.1 type IV secretion system protein [Lelliottia sp. V89_5]MDK9596132.1 type IV secretion system protein [Lelliottia sp. V89_10]